MADVLLMKEKEEKRLKDFQIIAENWDDLSDYARGKLDGIISAIASMCMDENAKKSG